MSTVSTVSTSSPDTATDPATDPATDTGAYRIEHDTMGEVRVPRDALWQAQTQRAVENFPISRPRSSPR